MRSSAKGDAAKFRKSLYPVNADLTKRMGAASFDRKDYCISNTALKSVEKYAYDPNLQASGDQTKPVPAVSAAGG